MCATMNDYNKILRNLNNKLNPKPYYNISNIQTSLEQMRQMPTQIFDQINNVQQSRNTIENNIHSFNASFEKASNTLNMLSQWQSVIDAFNYHKQQINLFTNTLINNKPIFDTTSYFMPIKNNIVFLEKEWSQISSQIAKTQIRLLEKVEFKIDLNRKFDSSILSFDTAYLTLKQCDEFQKLHLDYNSVRSVVDYAQENEDLIDHNMTFRDVINNLKDFITSIFIDIKNNLKFNATEKQIGRYVTILSALEKCETFSESPNVTNFVYMLLWVLAILISIDSTEDSKESFNDENHSH